MMTSYNGFHPSYNHDHRVVLNNNCSDWSAVLSGIPQGTVLGPLLFLMYINDLPQHCDITAESYLFADDAKIFKHITSTADHVSLQSSLGNLITWSNNWLLKLNTHKCKVASYGRNPDQSFIYTVTESSITHNIQRVNIFKDLGVWFDTKLSFSTHCHEKINKAYSMLGIIKRKFIYLPTHAFTTLYKAVVRSHLEYATTVWNLHHEGLIKSIEKVQMRATK